MTMNEILNTKNYSQTALPLLLLLLLSPGGEGSFLFAMPWGEVGGLNAVCGWDNLLHTDEFKKK